MIIIKNYRKPPETSKSLTLMGHFDIIVSELHGLFINRCCHFSKDGNAWVGMPSSSETDADGKKVFTPTTGFDSNDFNRKFLESVKKALLEYLSKNTETSKDDFGDLPF